MSIRTERIARLLQRELADILNTRFSQQIRPMVTVTNVRVTKDLSIAYVQISVLGDTLAQRQAGFKHVEDLTSEIRTELAARIRHQVRIIPELKFFLDETLNEAQHMEELFERIRAERARRES